MTRKIRVLDTTLRDGEQTPGVSLVAQQKLEIAKALDDIGVDVIEAGSAITSEGERESIKRIASEGLFAEISSFARIKKEDIDLALKCGVDSVFLVAPTSDLHIEYKLGTTRKELLKKTLEAVEYSKDHGLKVDLCTEDGSRSDPVFLVEVLSSAADYGIDRFTLADTVGILVPDKTFEMMSNLSKANSKKVALGIHCHDDLGLATANTVTAVSAGASMVDVAVNGLGERAGNAAFEEVVMALKLGYGLSTSVKTEKLFSLSNLVERIYGIPVAANKAIVGDNAFTHEAGIHVDGILKKAETYEAVKPELVGAKRTFVLGKHVGLKAVKKMLEDAGVKVSDEQMKDIFQQVKHMGDLGKRVTSTDLETITDLVLGIEKEKTLKVHDFVAISGNTVTPTASVKMKIDGREVVESSVGTGPVDAAINAIKHAAKEYPFELVEYHVDSISGGTDAMVKVMVTLKSSDRIVTAQGAGTDIVLASVDALVNGLNSLIRKLK